MKRIKGESLIVIVFICTLAFVLGVLIYRSNLELNREIQSVTEIKTQEKKKFEIWTVEGSVQTALNDEITRYQKLYPDVYFTVKAFKNEIYKENLFNAARTNSLPDMYYLWGDQGLREMIGLGAVKDITRAVTPLIGEQLQREKLKNYEIDGKIYGMPVFGWNTVMYCNTELFMAHGLDIPKTYTELLEVVEKFQAQGVTPMAIGGQEAWMPSLYYMSLVLDEANVNVVESAMANKQLLSTRPFVAAAEKMRKLIILRPWQNYYGDTTDEEAVNYFCEGKAAMLVGGSWMSAQIQDDIVTDIKEKTTVVPFPTDSGTGYFKGVAGYSDGFVLNTKSELNDVEVTEMYLNLVRDISNNVVEYKGVGLPIYNDQTIDKPSFTVIRQCYDIFPSGSFHSAYDQLLNEDLVEPYNEAIKSLEKGYITDKKFIELIGDLDKYSK